MSALKDQTARTLALTDIGRSLLVEAGAGSGKTSLLAGRITYLLASGVDPRSIAAVSFTEMAASELLGRITSFIDKVLNGNVPADLKAAFPDGRLTDDQRRNLTESRRHLGEMTCTTIHGFCQRLLKPYPVEADIDPGARILDPIGADLAFQDIFDAWLRERLDHTDKGRDLISALVAHDAYGSVNLIRELAELLRDHRDAAPEPAVIAARPCDDFIAAADDFHAFLGGLGFEQEDTRNIVSAFRELADKWREIHRLPEHLRIMAIAALDPSEVLVKKTDGEFRAYRMKGKWQKVAPKGMGEGLNDQATAHYEKCCEMLRSLRSNASACGLAMLVDEIRPLIDRYQAHKRNSALLDFDDLLVATRNMLRRHPEVREALGRRFSRIAVDEFQDTDPVQTEIFRHLAFDPPPGGGAPDMSDWVPRPGAIFLVGDPKQAIYRFRGADVRTYVATRDALRAIDPDCILEVGTNFRSCEGVLAFVNRQFETPLSADGQPGFAHLTHHREDHGQGPCVAAVDIEQGENSSNARDVEAKAVAELCSRLIGSYLVVRKDGTLTPCEPGDIALLAPTGTELWRYEAALEAQGIAVATQAGKGMFQRQEVQDLIAMTRVLADPRDRLALGALLRGPLVGLTEEELLDISQRLMPPETGGLEFLRVGTDTAEIAHPIARQVISTLAGLRRAARHTTPYDLLSRAVEDLRVRPILNARHDGNAERALANVDRFLEMSRPYSVRGLRALSDTMRRAWEDSERMGEGRPDAEEQSVSLITMHSAKGLEWPVVIPVNTLTEIMRSSRLLLDVATRRLSMPFLDIDPADYLAARATAAQDQSSERVRLWYVAATRARDLLILPRHVKAGEKTWAKVVELGLDDVPTIDVSHLEEGVPEGEAAGSNSQDRDSFDAEQERMESHRRFIMWHSPSRHEPKSSSGGRLSLDEIIDAVPEFDPFMMIKGSRERGVILHKLMEEVLTGETGDEVAVLNARAAELIVQMPLGDKTPADLDLNPAELARTVRRTLDLPAVAAIRDRLVPEVSIGSTSKEDGVEHVTDGVTDAAVPYADGSEGLEIVVDWKSDVRPEHRIVEQYRDQVRDYMELVGAERGLIVFMTTGEVIDVRPRQARAA